MKKILILVLMLGLITGCSIGKDNGQGNENNGTNTEDKVENIDYSKYIKTGSTLDKVDERKINLNGKEHDAVFVYSYDIVNGDYYDKSEVFNYYLTVFFDGKLTTISNASMGIHIDLISTTGKYPKMSTIKDTNTSKEYVLIDSTGNYVFEDHNIYVINEEGNKLYEENISYGFSVEVDGGSLSLLEISDTFIKVIKQDGCTRCYYETATIEDGVTVVSQSEILVPYEVAGGC